MGIGWIRRKLKLTGYDGGWNELEKWFDREPEVDGRGTMSDCSRAFWRYWNEIPVSGGAYEEVEYDLEEMMSEHESNHLWEDYEEAKAKANETVDGEEGFEAEREADVEEEESGDEEEDTEEDDEPGEEDVMEEEDDENGADEGNDEEDDEPWEKDIEEAEEDENGVEEEEEEDGGVFINKDNGEEMGDKERLVVEADSMKEEYKEEDGDEDGEKEESSRAGATTVDLQEVTGDVSNVGVDEDVTGESDYSEGVKRMDMDQQEMKERSRLDRTGVG